MKLFHISDVLSATTGRLVSTRHMDGIYDILNFLTGDSLFTHQLPHASIECEPWLRTQFPRLFPEDPEMGKLLDSFGASLEEAKDKAEIESLCLQFIQDSMRISGLPEMLPVYEMGADMHTRIDPVEELKAMVGDERVIVVNPEGGQ